MESTSKVLCAMLSVALLLLIFPTNGFAQDTLHVCLNVNPPWKIQDDQGNLEGPEVEIMQAIAKNLGLQIKIETAPFKRCLKYMESGKSDMMPGLLKNAEREVYIEYIDPPYKTKSNKAFYVLKGNADKITKYEDLASLTIGVGIGAKFFPRFDADTTLKKDAVSSYEQNIKKLLRGRIDTFVTTDSFADYLIQQMGVQDEIEKAKYGYFKENPVYIGIAKSSPLFKRKDEIMTKVNDMIVNGEIEQIISNFFVSHNLPIPEYK